jgi:prepilin-type N-terminal cleavage/methylation domain-containing protein
MLRQRAMTLVEMMVSVGVGSIALLMVGWVFVSSMVSFTALGNYVSINQSSRGALDRMSRDIRRSRNLISFATNQLVFNFSGSTNLTYTYDPTARTLTGWKTGDTITNTFLTGCDYFQFSMLANIPQPGGTLTNASSVSQAKAISVNWHCSRNLLGGRANTEYIQESVIVIRNKPVS